MIGKKSSFIDGNGQTVTPPDEVQYKFGERHGKLIEVFSDGDAYVNFFDKGTVELVKWKHLCKVPEEHKKPALDLSAKPFSLDDFVVIADERNNPSNLLDKERLNVTVNIQARYETTITFDKEGRIVAINGVDVANRLYAI